MTESFAYDTVTYPSMVHPQMHPCALAAIARLHGIHAASPAHCRLLEIGCGEGVQLLALAMAYPDSEFIGVDMSHAAIARGEVARTALGLGNLHLVAADLTNWDPGTRMFDYIIAHGFYSWVPQHVRECLLALCGKQLAPHGVAYVSYNALPGRRIRQMTWEMMKHHVRHLSDPQQRIDGAREFLMWLGENVPASKSYSGAVQAEAEHILNDVDPIVLFHDDLSDTNDSFSITEFIESARHHGMEFLAEASYSDMSDAMLTEECAASLIRLTGNDRVEREQYLDFLKGRRFRQTLLCRRTGKPSSEMQISSIVALEVVGALQTESGTAANLAAGKTERFVAGESASIATDHPVAKAALELIGKAFPQPVRFQDLLARSRTLAGSSAADAESVAEMLRTVVAAAFQRGLVDLQCDPPRFAATAGRCPLLSPLARLQLEQELPVLTSMRPSMVRLDSIPARELLRQLDGRKDRSAILYGLAASMSAMEIPGSDGRVERQPIDWWLEQLGPNLEDGLRDAARMALLVE